MKRRMISNSLASLFGLILFSGALWVLHYELKAYTIHDILRHLREIPANRLFWAVALTSLNYVIMTGYDTLALRYVQHPLSYARTALASFLGYAFSNNMGLGMLAGGSVRYRLYSGWGLSTFEITKVVAFCTLTLWIGFLTIGGVVFLFEPVAIPKALHLRLGTVQPVGILFLTLVVLYLLLAVSRRRPLRIRDWEFFFPSSRLLLAQLAIGVLDWAMAGSVLYSLMPLAKDLSYPDFLGIFLLAQTAGLVSQVPAGLGVFETMVLLLVSPTIPASETLGALLAFRAIYYILPLFLALALFGAQEIVQRKEGLHRLARVLGRVGVGVMPNILALATFVDGAILLFSGATPELRSRLEWLEDSLPLPIIELSHFLGSLCGTGLLLLARGLQRRIDAAYIFTLGLLGSGIVFSLLKGLDYEEAIILSITLGALIACRQSFYRKSTLLHQRFGPDWIAAIVLVLLCSVWLGMFSYKHVEYSTELWWRFAFSEDAPRFLRTMVGATAVTLFYVMMRLLRPASLAPTASVEKDLENVADIVRRSQMTYANLALLGDKLFLLSQRKNAFIMYGTEGRSWIAMGDPVGQEKEWPELIWRFLESCDHHDGRPAFYQVSQKWLSLYVDAGLTLLKIGEEARVPLDGFSLDGGTRKGLRHAMKKCEKEGCSFQMITREETCAFLPKLKIISDAWLKEKNTREKRFSLGFFNPDYLKHFSAAIIRKDGTIVAFANVWEGAKREELSLDLMRYLPTEHYGVIDYLLTQLMLWGKQEGFHWFNLGMAPLSGLVDQQLAPLWNRLGAFLFRHGEHFYNFQGLRHYKEKFDPVWEPKYLASSGAFELPRIFTNLAALVSGGLRGMMAK